VSKHKTKKVRRADGTPNVGRMRRQQAQVSQALTLARANQMTQQAIMRRQGIVLAASRAEVLRLRRRTRMQELAVAVVIAWWVVFMAMVLAFEGCWGVLWVWIRGRLG